MNYLQNTLNNDTEAEARNPELKAQIMKNFLEPGDVYVR